MDDRGDALDYIYHMHSYKYDIDEIQDYIHESVSDLLESGFLAEYADGFVSDFYSMFLTICDKYKKITFGRYEVFIKPELTRWLNKYRDRLNNTLVDDTYEHKYLKKLEFWGD